MYKQLSNLKRKLRYTRYFNRYDPFLKYPEKKFLIYTRGRTGSTVLTDLLNCHPDIFCDYEILNLENTKTRIKYPLQFIDSCSKRATMKGKSVYGFKVKIEQFRDDQKIFDIDTLFKKLQNNDWKFIYLKRSNSLQHKISGIISKDTKVFHVKKSEEFQHGKVKIDCQLLLDILNWGEELERMEEENLKTIPHLRITYEEDLLDNSVHQQTANKVFRFLNIKEFPVHTKLKKIIPLDLKEIILNYDEMCEFLKDTKFREYL